MRRDFRISVLKKLSQESVSGSPPNINIVSLYPNIQNIFAQNVIAYIQSLAAYLNTIIYYTSDSKYNLDHICRHTKAIDTSSIINADLKHIVNFVKEIINNILILRSDQKPSKQELIQHIVNLENSRYLNSISQINPTGQLATKIPQGDVRTNIKSYLRYIKNLISNQST